MTNLACSRCPRKFYSAAARAMSRRREPCPFCGHSLHLLDERRASAALYPPQRRDVERLPLNSPEAA